MYLQPPTSLSLSRVGSASEADDAPDVEPLTRRSMIRLAWVRGQTVRSNTVQAVDPSNRPCSVPSPEGRRAA